jgi:hypothetical protein
MMSCTSLLLPGGYFFAPSFGTPTKNNKTMLRKITSSGRKKYVLYAQNGALIAYPFLVYIT